MKILKIALGILLLGGVLIVLRKYYLCSRNGKKSGNPFKCTFMSAKPVFLTPEDRYTIMMDSKCYEVTEYGERLSYKRVEIEKCEDESITTKPNTTLAEYEIIEEYETKIIN